MMRRSIHTISIALITCTHGLWVSNTNAQDLQNIGKEDPLRISGGINLTSIAYNANGIDNRRDPFTWFANGNLNFSLYGWNIPLSFSYSNQQVNHLQPFNQYGIAPQYKWVKAYLGYNSMTFSPYTLAGHIFLGGGVELTPGKWRISAMYGRLNEAVEEDTLVNQSIAPMFRRMGAGVRVGIEDKKYALHAIVFNAWDDENSLSSIPVASEVFPRENLVLSLIGRKQITERITLNAEYATSALTQDTRAVETGGESVFRNAGPLFTPRASSQYFDAFNASVVYAGNSYALQLNYERIDPGYETLGAYFFNNDMENLTVSGNLRLLQDKINLAVNAGRQRNNLQDTETSATERLISSVNATFIPNAKWNITGSYSNFSTFTNVRPRFDPFFEDELDTLNFYQITQNTTATVSHSFGSRERRQGIMFNGSFQNANEETDTESAPDTDSRYYSGSASYRYTMTQKGLSLMSGVNFYQNELAGLTSTTIGPNLSVSKTMLDKTLRNTLSAGYNHQDNGNGNERKVLNVRLGVSYNPVQSKGNMPSKKENRNNDKDQQYPGMTDQPLPKEPETDKERKNKIFQGSSRHTFSLNVAYLRSFQETVTTDPFSELTGTISYSYSF